MRRKLCWLAGLLCLAAVGAAYAEPAAYITIERNHLQGFQQWHADKLARKELAGSALPTLTTVGSFNDIVAARVPENALAALSAYMHERRKVCGGFFAFETAEQAQEFLVKGAAAANEAAAFQVNHTVDNQAFVTPLLAQVQEPRIRSMMASLEQFNNRWYNGSYGRQSSEWIRDQWRALIPASRTEITVSMQSCTNCGQQQNVVLVIPGSDLASEIVVLGAHADSIVIGQSSETQRAPGADDDGSGVAVLTEVLRIAMQANYRPRRTVHFMAYAAEEVGLRGSQSLAQTYRNAGRDVVGVLQLDMTNYRNSATTRDVWLMTDNSNASLVTFFRELFSAYLSGSGLTLGDTSCGYACSDHASWTQNGFPAAMYSESKFGQHNQNIHTSRDTLASSGGAANHSVHFAKLGLAFMGEAAKGNGGGTGNPDVELQNNVPVNNINMASGEQKFYRLEVPSGAAGVRFVTSGGTGDIDVYAQAGSRPSTTTYACKSDSATTSETCTVNSPAAGTYYVLLHAYSTVSGVTLTGNY